MTAIQPLATISDALETAVAQAAPLVAAVGWGGRQHISAIRWGGDLVVTSEQSLPRAGQYGVVLDGGARLPALLVGRDPTTNVAVLRLDGAPPQATVAGKAGEIRVGALVLAIGSDGAGGPTARLGGLEVLGPAWESLAGGRIDSLMRLSLRLGGAAEGGPVTDARGGLLGMSTFGPRRDVMVIPAATIDRVLPALLSHGTRPRGWLGVGVHPVALPKEKDADAGSGLMVVNVTQGASADGIVLPGDILVSVDQVPVGSARRLMAALGPETVGRTVALKLVRGGTEMTVDVPIAARPSSECCG